MGKTPDMVPWRSGRQLGAAVRAARARMGLTQAELAKRARVGLKFLYELESGKETLRADKVFDVLGVLSLQLVVTSTPGKRQTRAAAQWRKDNRAAIQAYNEHVEKDGVFSEGLRSF
jgi:HTH-type transcriptional regulator/antitoxin HipB